MTLQEIRSQIENLDFVVMSKGFGSDQVLTYSFPEFEDSDYFDRFRYDFILYSEFGQSGIQFFRNSKIGPMPKDLQGLANLTIICSFEEIFEAASDDLKMKLIFHLDLFA